MNRLLSKTGEWVHGSDGKEYLMHINVELDWSLSDDNMLLCQCGPMYCETSGMLVIQTGANSFLVLSTGIVLLRDGFTASTHADRGALIQRPRILLSSLSSESRAA